MLALLEAFLQIITRRRGPEDLPDSQFLTLVALGLYMLAQFPVAGVLYGWTARAVLAILADAALLVLAFWALLQVTHLSARYRRTLTALAGTGALLALPQAPLVYLSQAATAAGQPPVGPTIGLLALLLWSIVVQAHITARALSRSFAVGLAVAFGYFILSYQLSGQFGPMAN